MEKIMRQARQRQPKKARNQFPKTKRESKPPPKPPVAKGRKQGNKAIIKDEQAMADLRKVWPKLAAQLPKLVKAEEQGAHDAPEHAELHLHLALQNCTCTLAC